MLEHSLWTAPDKVAIEVERGHVKLAGRLETRTEVELLERLAARVPGVVSVEAALTWREDDTSRDGVRRLVRR